MSPERNNEVPPEAANWHPPAENDVTGNDPEADKGEALKPESSLEEFQPTPENPIQEIRIGLWQTMGQVDHPTRIVMILKDGSTADMPWEQAEAILPPEYRTARELGKQARQLSRFVTKFETAIRATTDVMERSGHMKDALLKPLKRTRRPVQYLNEAADLVEEASNIAQESFLELRRMTNAKESHAEQLQSLADQLGNCQRRFDVLRENVGQNEPAILKEYESYKNHPSARLKNPRENRLESFDSNKE